MFSKVVTPSKSVICLSCATAAAQLSSVLEASIGVVHDLIKPMHAFRQFGYLIRCLCAFLSSN